MDVRLRFMQDAAEQVVFATAGGRRVPAPSAWFPLQAGVPGGRKDLFNSRIHGGSIGDDAIMITLGYPLASHNNLNQSYTTFIQRAFGMVYGGLSVNDAYWLGKILSSHPRAHLYNLSEANPNLAARKGDENDGTSHNVDWRYCIGLIDAYVYLRDLSLPNFKRGVANGTAPELAAMGYKQAATNFTTLTKQNLERLIRSAQANQNWNASNANLAALDAAIKAVEQSMDGPAWTGQNHPAGVSAWSDFKNQNKYRAWAPTAFLQGDMAPNRCLPVPVPAPAATAMATSP